MTVQSNETAAVRPAQPARRSPAILILALVAMAQLALIAWLFWPQPSQAAAGTLFAGLDPAQVQSLAIDWEDKVITLTRSGDGWVLPDKGDFPANASAVTDLLTKLAQVDTSRLVAGNAASHARLRVDEQNPVRRVEITAADGTQTTLYVGTSPNARATNVRAGGSDNVYLTSALSTGDLRVDTTAWVDTQFLNLDPATIDSLNVENAQGAFTLTKESSGAWTLPELSPGDRLITGTVEGWVRNLATLGLSDVLGSESLPAYGLDAPTATLTLDFQATPAVTGTVVPAAPVQLLIGAKDDASGSYAVKASTSPWIVRVAAATLDPLVLADRAALVAPPPATESAPVTATAALTETESVTP